jgi:hypothetical protein
MIALLCDNGWLECLKDAFLKAVSPVVEGLIS